MTQNQLKYWELQETMRTNRANEIIKSDTVDETKRSNLAREGENVRTNKANEAIKRQEATTREKRADVQNVTDVLNSLTSGFSNIMKGVK